MGENLNKGYLERPDPEDEESGAPATPEEVKDYQAMANVPEPLEKSLTDWEKDWITPGQMARALSGLTAEQKKDFNWMVGGGETWQRLGGVKLAYYYKR